MSKFSGNNLTFANLQFKVKYKNPGLASKTGILQKTTSHFAVKINRQSGMKI